MKYLKTPFNCEFELGEAQQWHKKLLACKTTRSYAMPSMSKSKRPEGIYIYFT